MVECITATEEICQKLDKGEAEELRAEVKKHLEESPPSKAKHNQGRMEGNRKTEKR